MKKSQTELLSRISPIISRLPCDYAEARISSGESTTISLSGREIDNLSSGESVSGSIRVLNKGAWGFVSFNNILDFEKNAARAVEISSRIKAEKKSRIISCAPVVKNFTTKVKTDFKKISIDEKFRLVKSYNDILLSSSYIQTTRTTYREGHSNWIYVNTEGSRVSYDRSFCGVALASIARDGTNIQPFYDSFSGYGGFELVADKEESAERVVKTAVDLLKAESISGGTYNIVIDPHLAGVFIHEAFGHLSEADFVYENDRMMKLMTLGKRVGPEALNVIDDGSIPGLTGYIPVDDEGIPSRKNYLIKNGILSGRLHSRETAQKLGEEITGNARAVSVIHQPIVRMTNTFIDNGTASFQDMLSTLDDGLYVVDAIGGQTNLEMFTFSAGYAFEVKNGKTGKMYKDIVLSGNVFKTLESIDMIGNDIMIFGGLGGCGKGGQSPLPVTSGGPHLLIKNVLIGGSQK